MKSTSPARPTFVDSDLDRATFEVDMLAEHVEEAGVGLLGGSQSLRAPDGRDLTPRRNDAVVFRVTGRSYVVHMHEGISAEAVEALRHFAADLLDAAAVVEREVATWGARRHA